MTAHGSARCGRSLRPPAAEDVGEVSELAPVAVGRVRKAARHSGAVVYRAIARTAIELQDERAGGLYGRAADGVVAEAELLELGGLVEVASVEDDVPAHERLHTLEVRQAKLVPLRHDG